MKTIGLIGGMSWESTAVYYQLINQMVEKRLGGLHSADCLMYSFDFAEIEQLQSTHAWDIATTRLIQAAQALERGGAACIVICSNTMHRMADQVQAAVSLPLIHISDPTAKAIHEAGIHNVGLLGTIYTMEQDFYKARLAARHGLNISTPNEKQRHIVNHIIYDELVRGIIKPESKATYKQVIDWLAAQGAQGVILGCTEIGMLIKPEDSPIPTFDTTELHAAAAVAFALGDV